MPSVALLISPDALDAAYPEPVMQKLRALVREVIVITPANRWTEFSAKLAHVEVLFSGWGAPLMDAAFLEAMPKLKLVCYAGGSVRYFVTPAFWAAGVRLTTAQAQNAIPVAEFVASALVLGQKRVWHYARVTRATRSFPALRPMPGNYGSVVGLISYGTIARLVRERLRSIDCTVLVYDPFLSDADAAAEGMQKVELEEIFARADAVSVHTPHLPQTADLITGRHLAAMKSGAFFINTARGEVVREAEMIDVLSRRPDIQAFLDVTAPEPPRPDSPLYTLPNVVLTPHIAGSVGAECQRMGLAMVDEYLRFRAGDDLKWEVTPARAESIA